VPYECTTLVLECHGKILKIPGNGTQGLEPLDSQDDIKTVKCQRLAVDGELLVVHGVDVKSAPHARHTASRISWLHTRGSSVENRKRAGQFSLKTDKG
jgi:hypothetical protein